MRNQNKHNNKKDYPSDEREGNPELSTEETNPTATHGRNSVDREKKPNNHKKCKLNPFQGMTTQKVNVWLTGIIAFATIINVCGFIYESESTSKQVDRIIGKADSVSKSMEETARQSKTSLDATIDNFRLEQRAWVGIRYIIDDGGGYGPFLKEGQKFNIKIGINNTGKSLAKNVKVSLTAQKITAGNDPIKKQITAKSINIGVIHPDSWTDLIPPSIGVVTASDIGNIKSGRHTLYLTGKITYEDAFKRPHETIFCKQLSPDLSGFAACPFYNDAD